MDEALIASLVVFGSVSFLGGVVLGWFITNEEWKAVWRRTR